MCSTAASKCPVPTANGSLTSRMCGQRIGGGVEGCGGDFGCGAGATERNAGLGPLDKVVLLGRCKAVFVEDRGDDRTGADGVDPDAARRQFLGDSAAERTQCRLGRTIDR